MTSAQAPPHRTWTFDLPMTKPLSMNARQHWRPKARAVSHVRRMTLLLAQQKQIPPCGRIAVELHYAPRDSRRRDPLNLVATLKPVEDGLVDAGVVPDDTEQFVEPTMPKIDPPLGAGYGRIYVVVHELEPADAGPDTHTRGEFVLGLGWSCVEDDTFDCPWVNATTGSPA